jgi:hypothetical protein
MALAFPGAILPDVLGTKSADEEYDAGSGFA